MTWRQTTISKKTGDVVKVLMRWFTLPTRGRLGYGSKETKCNVHADAFNAVVNLFWFCVGFELMDQSQRFLLRRLDGRLTFWEAHVRPLWRVRKEVMVRKPPCVPTWNHNWAFTAVKITMATAAGQCQIYISRKIYISFNKLCNWIPHGPCSVQQSMHFYCNLLLSWFAPYILVWNCPYFLCSD